MPIIYLPKNINLETTAIFFKQLESNFLTEDVYIDINKVQFSTPTSMLLIGSKLKAWRAARSSKQLRTGFKKVINSEAISYLGHMGFFDFIGSKKMSEKKWGKHLALKHMFQLLKLKSLSLIL